MAEKDIRAKKLESNPEVFASIFNGLLFQNELIHPDGLKQIATESFYDDGKDMVRIQNRDLAMSYSEEGNTHYFGLAILGVENQSELDDIETIRVMGYDYGNYRSQVDYYKGRLRVLNDLLLNAPDEKTKSFVLAELGKIKRFTLVPTITVVLNFNRRKWNNASRLTDLVDMNNKFRKWMSDYSIYVFDMCHLTEKQISYLSGDFAEVAKVFTYGTKSRDYNQLKYPMDVLDLLIAYRNEDVYVEARNRIALLEKKGDVITMGTLVDELERNKIIDTAKKAFSKGRTSESVIEILVDGLDVNSEEAKIIFEREILGLITE